MNEIDILKSISENLSERKSCAALNNYEVLCNNIEYVNNLLSLGVDHLREIQNQISSSLKRDEDVLEILRDNTQPLFYFRNIIPQILLNNINILDKFIAYTLPDDRHHITIDNVGELRKDFMDYNNLVTSSRQLIDSLVVDSYQLTLLDAKLTNYQVLVSLNSFNKYVTPSIRQGLFNTDIETSLNTFESLPYNQWTNSAITKCDDKTFANKVDFLFSNLGLTTEDDFKDEIKNLFKFSSEFTHIGYVSTLFTSSNKGEVIFTDSVSPYLPSTENFSELKYKLLETMVNFFAKIYLPSLTKSVEKLFQPRIAGLISTHISINQSLMVNNLKTRNNEYYFFIMQGMIGSDQIIDLTCMCEVTNNWQPPHNLAQIYCKGCGSKFKLLEISGDPGYILTDNGPVKVIGSSVPEFSDLSPQEQQKLIDQCKSVAKQPSI
jgi:hypothetical protein